MKMERERGRERAEERERSVEKSNIVNEMEEIKDRYCESIFNNTFKRSCFAIIDQEYV